MRHLAWMHPSDGDADAPGKNILATFDRLLAAVTRAVELAGRAGASADEALECARLAALDAIELGGLLGTLTTTSRRRASGRRSGQRWTTWSGRDAGPAACLHVARLAYRTDVRSPREAEVRRTIAGGRASRSRRAWLRGLVHPADRCRPLLLRRLRRPPG